MKRLSIGLLFCLIGFPAIAMDELVIKAGKSFVVDRKLSNLNLQSLTIEDNAVIRLSPAVKTWVLNAEKANIGVGVSILARGSDGANGSQGRSYPDLNTCSDGSPGGSGLNGQAGSSGQSIRWSVGIESFGSLNVDLSGGDGGSGGNGGDGQNLPNLKNCKASGGDAGNGANGASGGDGGSFRFHYWSDEPELADLTRRFSVNINGGKGGQAGQPGLPGVGSTGFYSNKKSLSGNKTWVAGGRDGASAPKGLAGLNGRSGGLDIRLVQQEDDSAASIEPLELDEVEASVPSSVDERVRALEILVQKLEARIKLLELDRL